MTKIVPGFDALIALELASLYQGGPEQYVMANVSGFVREFVQFLHDQKLPLKGTLHVSAKLFVEPSEEGQS